VNGNLSHQSQEITDEHGHQIPRNFSRVGPAAFGQRGRQRLPGAQFAAVKQSSDGGYLIAGCYELGADPRVPFLLKLDTNGNEEWRKSYNLGSGNEAWFLGISPERYCIG
jgi:hypothetical protein